MISENIKKFLMNAGPIFFVTPNPIRAIGLENELPDFHIICSEESGETNLLEQSGANIFCLSEHIRNSGKLLADDRVLNYIRQNSEGGQVNIMTFKPSPMIEKVCEKNGFRYLGNSSSFNRNFEDKVSFAEITDSLNIPNANSRILKIDKNISADVLDFNGDKKYVVQFARGYSGNSTFLVNDEKDFEKIISENLGRRIKISDYKEGDTYTFDVCIGDFGTMISQPIFQITGFAEFNKNKLGTCGNDYSLGVSLDDDIRKDIRGHIEKMADELSLLGYRGIVGFDFVVSGREAHMIEMNPRLVGSIPVFTKLQLSGDEIPFLLLHLLSFLCFDFGEMDIKNEVRDYDFSQLIMRNVQDVDVTILKTLKSGIYKMQTGKAVLQRETYFAHDIGQDEFFIECAAEDSTIGPDMEYANIQFSYGIMEDRNKIKEVPQEIIKAVLGEITLEPNENGRL